MINCRVIIINIVCLLLSLGAAAQEIVTPIQYNPHDINLFPKQKKRRATLPFFDDFSNKSSLPNPTLWEEQQVFINNTMGIDVPTQGVATFDGLNEQGHPYRPNDFSAIGFGDSLTCTPIDLSFRSAGDSVILSFWVQPQGNGFSPEVTDSLFLFFKNASGQWNSVWTQAGSLTHPFTQHFVTLTDAQYFHASFQFRFINFTSLNLNDDVWNIDYVELDENRSVFDTTANDLSFTDQPSSILAEYTAMPFRQFIASDLSAQQDINVRNIYDIANNFTVHHRADEVNTTMTISSNTLAPFNAIAKSIGAVNNPSYTLSLSGMGPHIVQNNYWVDRLNAADPASNDTIQTQVVFDNYFAYDDGSAEKAYFLYTALNQAAKTAMRFDLRQPDSVYGLSVYFAPQVPSAANKFFSIVLYDSLGNTSAGDVIIKQQDLYKVQYPSQRGELSSYAFDTPIGLAPGTYYIGITQPANFGSDSIYYGLDVNNDNNINKLSYNVDGFWYNSSVTGTVMLRPMVGAPFIPTDVTFVDKRPQLSLYPNPVASDLYIKSDVTWTRYTLINYQGQLVQKGQIKGHKIELENIASGAYLLQLINPKTTSAHKIWKQ